MGISGCKFDGKDDKGDWVGGVGRVGVGRAREDRELSSVALSSVGLAICSNLGFGVSEFGNFETIGDESEIAEIFGTGCDVDAIALSNSPI
jgi:hypothetical protein